MDKYLTKLIDPARLLLNFGRTVIPGTSDGIVLARWWFSKR